MEKIAGLAHNAVEDRFYLAWCNNLSKCFLSVMAYDILGKCLLFR